MKVAIFGGTGFVGNYLVSELLDNGYQVNALIRPGSEHKLSQIKECNVINGCIEDENAVEEVIKVSDVVIYNIGIIREFKSQGITYQKLHFDYTKLIIDQAKKYNIEHFILMSANGVKNQGTGYQSTKYLGEKYLKNSGLNYTIFRPSLIFGKPYDDQEFCSQLRDIMLNLPIPAPLFFEGVNFFNAGKFSMSPIHVENVAYFFSNSVLNNQHYMKTYHLGGIDNFNWKKIIQTIVQSLNKNKWMLPTPITPVKILAILFDRFSFFPITRDQITMLLEGNTCDSKNLFKIFNINPILFNTKSLSYLNNK